MTFTKVSHKYRQMSDSVNIKDLTFNQLEPYIITFFIDSDIFY